MAENDDDIPVLTDAIERTSPGFPAASSDELAALEARLCASSLRFAEDVLRDASRDAASTLVEQVMRELRAELPDIVRRALHDHFDRH